MYVAVFMCVYFMLTRLQAPREGLDWLGLNLVFSLGTLGQQGKVRLKPPNSVDTWLEGGKRNSQREKTIFLEEMCRQTEHDKLIVFL